jgi:signal transduction histidine kinase
MVTVYVIDDDPLVRESLGTALRLETPYTVRAFASGAEALDSLRQAPPDVVISDFKMPSMDGLAVLKAVRKERPEAVLMLLTGYSDKDSAIIAVNEVGIFAYVEKPWDLNDLLLKIRAGLERQDLLRRLRDANGDLERRNADLERSHDELRHANDALRVAQERLVKSERLAAVGRVASGIAHEIGNQLALVGYAEAIKARSSGNAEITELSDVIVAAQKRLAAMVGEIKDFTRGDAQAALPLEPADVSSIVEEALAILRYDRDVGNRKLVRETRKRPLARLHRGKFAQVLINVIRNAAQASPPKAPIEIILDETERGDVVVVVVDHGVGMAPEILARLGEPFFTTRGESGTGLGIGISRRIVAEHGGTLAFSSTPGEGTRVTITIPGLGGPA